MTDCDSQGGGEPGWTGQTSPASPDGDHRPVIDASVPHSARVWNYWLGGQGNGKIT